MILACKKCQEPQSSLKANKICQKCEIGNKDPILWFIEQSKSKIDITKKTNTTDFISFSIDGDYIGNRLSKKSEKNVVMGFSVYNLPNKELYFNITRWSNGGETAFLEYGRVRISNIDSFVEEALPHFIEALAQLVAFAKSNNFCCVGCKKTFPNNLQSGRYFAGLYCASCWSKFKMKNSSKCGLCRRPMYECYC